MTYLSNYLYIYTGIYVLCKAENIWRMLYVLWDSLISISNDCISNQKELCKYSEETDRHEMSGLHKSTYIHKFIRAIIN
jgi:hypothetical protein